VKVTIFSSKIYLITLWKLHHTNEDWGLHIEIKIGVLRAILWTRKDVILSFYFFVHPAAHACCWSIDLTWRNLRFVPFLQLVVWEVSEEFLPGSVIPVWIDCLLCETLWNQLVNKLNVTVCKTKHKEVCLREYLAFYLFAFFFFFHFVEAKETSASS